VPLPGDSPIKKIKELNVIPSASGWESSLKLYTGIEYDYRGSFMQSTRYSASVFCFFISLCNISLL